MMVNCPRLLGMKMARPATVLDWPLGMPPERKSLTATGTEIGEPELSRTFTTITALLALIAVCSSTLSWARLAMGERTRNARMDAERGFQKRAGFISQFMGQRRPFRQRSPLTPRRQGKRKREGERNACGTNISGRGSLDSHCKRWPNEA